MRPREVLDVGATGESAEGGDGDDDASLPPSPSEDSLRVRRLWRMVGIGFAAAVGVTVLAAFGGASGRAGAAILFLLSAATCATVAAYGVIVAIVDDLRERPVSRRRVGSVVGLFVAAAALMAMTAGVGG